MLSSQQPFFFRTNTAQKSFTHGAPKTLTWLYSHHAEFQIQPTISCLHIVTYN